MTADAVIWSELNKCFFFAVDLAAIIPVRRVRKFAGQIWYGPMTKHGCYNLFRFRCPLSRHLCDKCAIQRFGMLGLLQEKTAVKRSKYFYRQRGAQRFFILSDMFAPPGHHKRTRKVDFRGQWLQGNGVHRYLEWFDFFDESGRRLVWKICRVGFPLQEESDFFKKESSLFVSGHVVVRFVLECDAIVWLVRFWAGRNWYELFSEMEVTRQDGFIVQYLFDVGLLYTASQCYDQLLLQVLPRNYQKYKESKKNVG